MAVADHELACSLVREAGADLRGTAVASVSPLSTEDARAFDQVVRSAGGRYLDLAVLGSPSEVRAGAAVLLVSGDTTALAANQALLERVGRVARVGESPGAAYAAGNAVVLAYLPLSVGLLQGRRLWEQQDIPTEWFQAAIMEFYPRQIRLLLDRVDRMPTATAEDMEGSIEVMGAWAAELGGVLADSGQDARMLDALHRMFAAASAAGQGDAAWTHVADADRPSADRW